MTKERPHVLQNLSQGQNPKVLWITCADSRVSPELIAGFDMGEVFVHRNIANLCPVNDVSFQSVLYFAIEVAKVQDIVVCGHTNCAGIQTALECKEMGPLGLWLRMIRDVSRSHMDLLTAVPPGPERITRLAELNVVEQARNVFKCAVFQKARVESRGRRPGLHGLLFDIGSGLLHPVPVRLGEFVRQYGSLYQVIPGDILSPDEMAEDNETLSPTQAS